MISLAQFTVSCDNSIIALAARLVAENYGGGIADIQLINMAYGLVAGIFMITGSFIGSRIGWRRNFAMGCGLAALGELVAAFAPSLAVFIALGRGLVGVGASFVISSVLGSIPVMYAGKRREFAFGCIAAAVGASALAPLLLGMVLDGCGYQVLLLGLAALFVVILCFSRLLPDRAESGSRAFESFDVPGFVLCSLGLGFILFGFASISTCGFVYASPQSPVSLWGFSPSIPCVTLGTALMAAAARCEWARESRGLRVLLPRSFWMTRAARRSLFSVGFGFFAVGAVAAVVVPFCQIALNASGTETGLASAMAGAVMAATGLVAPRIKSMDSPRDAMRFGYLMSAIGFAVISIGFGGGRLNGWIYLGLAAVGLGVGMVNARANAAVVLAVGERDAAQSGGIQGTVRDLAQALAAALLGSVLVFSLVLLGRFDVGRAPALIGQVGFAGDPAIVRAVDQAGLEGLEREEAIDGYRRARGHAGQIVMGAMSAFSLASLCLTGGLPGVVHASEDAVDASDRCGGTQDGARQE
ncbi:MAG: MFS transporter [Collinsella sp.]|nr:MFS transporter [Collinsella sp.]